MMPQEKKPPTWKRDSFHILEKEGIMMPQERKSTMYIKKRTKKRPLRFMEKSPDIYIRDKPWNHDALCKEAYYVHEKETNYMKTKPTT